MTKIQIDDGKSAKTEVDSTPTKKAVRKIAITEAPKEEKKAIKHQASHPVNSTATHSILQKSTTLSRRYVKKPVSATTVKEEKKAEPAKAEKKAEPVKAEKKPKLQKGKQI